MKVILFKSQGMSVGILQPTVEALQRLPIEEIAKKDVPAGHPYKIIEISDMPSYETRDAWEWAVETPDGYGIGHDAWIRMRGRLVAN